MILDDILARTRADLEVRKKAQPALEFYEENYQRGAKPKSLAAALRRPGAIACIAEFKRRSPSAGWINEKADLETTVRAYAAGGASALSVLTDEPFFGGRLGDLKPASAASGLPVLRKDFIVDPYQVAEAIAAGADAILLIVAALDDDELRDLLALATELSLDALVEVHDERELEWAAAAGATLVGVNNRDLSTFVTSLETTERLAPLRPAEALLVAESGLHSSADVRRMVAAGAQAVLIGEAFMAAPDPGAALAEFLR